ncbi:uncharacterized protein LAESUDRAFT_447475 [Laetiporus sulphureus 93-53]|uniref:Uncharacterized protein n=1 Tax=Laetiporus sulphureus 93-53 TaxID=1314785 RepID=A0A165BYC8_9APHY|nr:uncharacterized protein LAESUDRAFT_447475 [Laetiporus sulphureus 93-53]KZT01873.1 hypothetical protein LAESUDRAFT_447475 [Laetiporus sulphureus 93-53]
MWLRNKSGPPTDPRRIVSLVGLPARTWASLKTAPPQEARNATGARRTSPSSRARENAHARRLPQSHWGMRGGTVRFKAGEGEGAPGGGKETRAQEGEAAGRRWSAIQETKYASRSRVLNHICCHRVRMFDWADASRFDSSIIAPCKYMSRILCMVHTRD